MGLQVLCKVLVTHHEDVAEHNFPGLLRRTKTSDRVNDGRNIQRCWKGVSMEPATRYREMRFYQKRGLTLRLAIPSFLKNGTLLLTAVLAYRQSTHAAAKALSLLAGGKAVMQVLSRVLVPQLLLMINEEGISYTPSTFFFKLNVKLAWQEIASIYIGTASLSRASIEPHNQEVQSTLSMLFPQQPVRGTARLLCITLKDVEAFKRSRGFQNMETFKEGRNLLDIALRRVPVQAFVEKIAHCLNRNLLLE